MGKYPADVHSFLEIAAPQIDAKGGAVIEMMRIMPERALLFTGEFENGGWMIFDIFTTVFSCIDKNAINALGPYGFLLPAQKPPLPK